MRMWKYKKIIFISWEIWDIMKQLNIDNELDENVKIQINYFHFLGKLG
jgi:hypothetical protein